MALALDFHHGDEVSRAGRVVYLLQSARIFRERDDGVFGSVNDKDRDLFVRESRGAANRIELVLTCLEFRRSQTIGRGRLVETGVAGVVVDRIDPGDARDPIGMSERPTAGPKSSATATCLLYTSPSPRD